MDNEILGYLKYDGESVSEGYMGVRQSAEALTGFDDTIRYFVSKQAPSLARSDFDIPIRIQRGSWEAIIPNNLHDWIQTAIGLGATAYLSTAAKKMAENDFKDLSLSEIFGKSIKAIQWVIKIGIHLGSLRKRKQEKYEWRNGNDEIGIYNDSGALLFVPYVYFEFYAKAPLGIISKITHLVEKDRSLVIGFNHDGQPVEEKITYEHKGIFCPEDDEVLFPELEHGMDVQLDGIVTRGNENSNTIGFQYDGHILTCMPKKGSIVKHKPALFLEGTIIGTITRANKLGEPVELRPKIIFDHIISTSSEPPSAVVMDLFDEDK